MATGFTYARGTAQVLLIEGTRGEHAELVRALREKKLEVKTLVAPGVGGGGNEGGDTLPDDLGQLQPFDTVILGNVPKDSLTESQQRLLEANVHDMGAGLIMLGGENSFGAGGWMNTPIEKALPVDMQIKAMKVQGKGALVQIMHATEIPEGNYWMKVIAQEAIKTLSSYDYCGMVHWEGQEAWLFTIRPVGNGKASMLRAIDRMTPGDMPAFDPTLQLSLTGLRKVQDAMTKHIILISDGDPAAPSPQVINQLIANKITVTTVIVAAHGNDPGSIATMRDIAVKTKGRFYQVTNPKALPADLPEGGEDHLPPPDLRAAQALAAQRQVHQRADHRPHRRPSRRSPAWSRPAPRRAELVEVPIISPLPAEQPPPLLAHWTYGLGRSVAFTSDAGRKWATAWPSWENYAAFWSQVVRWSMRPVDNRNLTLNVRREEGKIKVVVDALDKESQFLNFLQIQGSVLSPDLKRTRVDLVQTAPGRYEGVVENAEASGNYFVNLGYSGPDNIKGVVSTGVSVPYSDEYRELKSNPGTLETIASLTNGEVLSWKRRADGSIDLARTLDESQPFRRDAVHPDPPGALAALAAPPVLRGRDVPGRRGDPPGLARLRADVEADSRTSGRSSGAARSPRRSSTWRSSRAARPRSPTRSTAPAPPPATRPRPPPTPRPRRTSSTS